MADDASVHQICDQFVDDFAAAHPVAATLFGVAGDEEKLTDYSPDAHTARFELAKRALSALAAVEPADSAERVAKAVFTERVSLDVEIHESGLDLAALNPLDSPVQHVRTVFDLMPTDSVEHWETIATRLTGVPSALDGVRSSLLTAADAGHVAALRQVTKVAAQADKWGGRGDRAGFFSTLVSGATEVPDSLRAQLDHGAQIAEQGYADLAEFLRTELAPKAPTKDAVGVDVYRLWSRYFLGATLDLQEAYEWGWAEFSRIEAEMRTVANRIKPGASLAEVAAALDEEQRYQVHGRRAFEEWMQALTDQALNALRDKHFDIPDRLMALGCKIAPPGGSLGAYYFGPNEDFTRPGRMWWSVAADQESFSTWREVTTVYHEGVPGHHLQVATAVNQGSTLNKFQRMLSFTSGHGEGWALYAERLMQDLGFLEDDGNLFGMLNAQLFRAARVVVDLGMHLELEIPSGTNFHAGERWTPDLGLEFVLTRTLGEPDTLRDEIDRYLGWPGQAPAYKLGERLWLAAREDARHRQGETFNIKDFHTRALRLGGMGLDTLREQLAELE